jgi:hypothetical protein
MSTPFNDLLTAWLVLKGRTEAPEFDVFEWVNTQTIEAATIVSHDECADLTDVLEYVEQRLVLAIAKGVTVNEWPWTNTGPTVEAASVNSLTPLRRCAICGEMVEHPCKVAEYL